MLTVVDYGMGNIGSVVNALDFLSVECRVSSLPEDILASSRLILPGVGSFRMAMENLNRLDLVEPLNEAALQKRIPVLGICLGMQLLAESGDEDGQTRGLGWISGEVKQIILDDPSFKIPHIGFNTALFQKRADPLFLGLGQEADFYFVHSYSMVCSNGDRVTSWVDYGKKLVASVRQNNIHGVQFHPEKSQTNGLKMLRNFAIL